MCQFNCIKTVVSGRLYWADSTLTDDMILSKFPNSTPSTVLIINCAEELQVQFNYCVSNLYMWDVMYQYTSFNKYFKLAADSADYDFLDKFLFNYDYVQIIVMCNKGMNRSGYILGVLLDKMGYDNVINKLRSIKPGCLFNESETCLSLYIKEQVDRINSLRDRFADRY